MKQKELSVLLRGIAVLCGLVWLFFALNFVKGMYHVLTEPNDSLVPNLLCFLLLFPAALAIFDAWNIFTDIGSNRSFTKKNAKRLRRISHCALTDTILILALAVCTFLGHSDPELFLAFDLPIFSVLTVFGMAATVAAAALSHLTLKASELQDENDLTI